MPRSGSVFGPGGRYVLGRKLGEGAFAKVRLATDGGGSDGEDESPAPKRQRGGKKQGAGAGKQKRGEHVRRVAVKIMKTKDLQAQGRFASVKREVAVMRYLAEQGSLDRHVVKLLDLVQTKSHVYLVMELCPGGELFELVALEKRFSENRARKYFHQLISAVDCLHRAGLCHRDLKPENILLSEDRKHLKLTDFGLSGVSFSSSDQDGLAAASDGINVLHADCGTPQYAAPEVVGNQGYMGDAADLWSCGVILYVMVAGFVPFDDQHSEAAIREKVQEGRLKFPRWFSDELR
jgi:serine/threonine protein kinase